MGFADEWTTVGTRLNGRPADGRTPKGGGGVPDLDIDTAALRDLAKKTGTLHGRMTTALTELEKAHTGLAAATEGFTCTGTLGKVRSSWEGRLRDVRNECARLKTAFTSAAEAHDGNENDTKEKMSSLSSKPSWREDRPKSPIANFS
ncbi:hypothetical protein GCM10010420_54140 [Streptomyces glaucosporus]|uniref:Uncharacterized protein n=1 Tax=Streptomyces glaucosporus TaxID=284044 RepID=A0ABN3IZQ3_9ACTN